MAFRDSPEPACTLAAETTDEALPGRPGAAAIEQYEASYCRPGGKVDNKGQRYDRVGSAHIFRMHPGARLLELECSTYELNCTQYRGFDRSTQLYVVQRVMTIQPQTEHWT
ncbi:hypothetical protein EYF80_047686 [Liparis tanakae]|uniref:Uncharacterized protein n=1 Tax=Liparis tanakae TaxID=230148 RepID=A0A4Z2FMZ5_9TELE|nr:hypothetical protein EYF80_047686 [Liparis tanakae]